MTSYWCSYAACASQKRAGGRGDGTAGDQRDKRDAAPRPAGDPGMGQTQPTYRRSASSSPSSSSPAAAAAAVT